MFAQPMIMACSNMLGHVQGVKRTLTFFKSLGYLEIGSPGSYLLWSFWVILHCGDCGVPVPKRAFVGIPDFYEKDAQRNFMQNYAILNSRSLF